MPDPLYVTLANEFRALLVARDAAAVAEMARRWLEVEAALLGQLEALATRLAAQREAGVVINQSLLNQEQRYQILLNQVREQMATFTADVAQPLIEQNSTGAAVQGLDDAAQFINGVAGVAVEFNQLGIEASERLIALARPGGPLRQILERSYPAAVEGITNLLLQGVAQGINPREIARRVVADGLSQGLNHILLVARDQQIRAYREASLAQYQQSGLVTGYVRHAAKQTRTCLGCLALDGKFYRLDEPFIEHPQGRCTRIPVVQGMERPQFQTGAAWFADQPEEIQREMMGAGRYEAWQAGQFAFDDLAKITPNAIWGPSVNPTPLKELV